MKTGIILLPIQKIIVLCLICTVLCFSNPAYTTSIHLYDSIDFKTTRYWQGLYSSEWDDWQVKYNFCLASTHDKLYEQTQKAGKGGYFKSGEILQRPLIIWFVYKEGKISEPGIIKSSGSHKYDLFNIEIIKNTPIPDFPEDKSGVFMWDGEMTDLVDYLKSRNVLPVSYYTYCKILPEEINWANLR